MLPSLVQETTSYIVATMSSNNTHISTIPANENSGNDPYVQGGNALTHVTNGIQPQAPFKTNIEEQPITQGRRPYAFQKGDLLTNAGTARATIAASQESPNGTIEGNYARDHQHQTV